MTTWNRCHKDRNGFSGLIHYNDKGPQCITGGFFELHALNTIQTSIGSADGPYDSALAEIMDGGRKAELINNPAEGSWKSKEQPEAEDERWARWYNNCSNS